MYVIKSEVLILRYVADDQLEEWKEEWNDYDGVIHLSTSANLFGR
jgi:hypothetical protein